MSANILDLQLKRKGDREGFYYHRSKERPAMTSFEPVFRGNGVVETPGLSETRALSFLLSLI